MNFNYVFYEKIEDGFIIKFTTIITLKEFDIIFELVNGISTENFKDGKHIRFIS